MPSVDYENIRVGCCGFSTSQQKYYELFPVVELQSTFYRLPETGTAKRWRTEAPPKFEFCLKAWQAITHPSTSATWKRVPPHARPASPAKCGDLKPTRQNFDAWKRTLEICKILNAAVCVVQCPPSFDFSRGNAENVRRFLGEIDRGSTKIAWEPRGDWKEHPDEIEQLCHELDLIYAVDILRNAPAIENEICYFRLHGLGPREYNYKYDYSSEDLERLKEVALKTLDRGAKEAFILFNNLNMLKNARSFNEMIRAIQRTDVSSE
jgi:uncharacterized protein YecE (DUF72 family)